MATAPEASSSASPITQVSQGDQGIPDALAASIITQVSPNSPNPGAGPQRPVKAQRQPKAKRQEEGDSTDPATGSPASAGEEGDDQDVVDRDRPDPNTTDGMTGTTATKSVNTPGGPGATGTDSLSKDSPAPLATTGDQSSTLKSADVKPAPVAAAAAAPPPTSSAPRAAAANTTKPRSVKKKGALGGLFACFGCFGSDAHDDRPAARPNSTSAPSSNTGALAEEKAEPAALSEKKAQDSATSTAKTAVTPAAGPNDLSTDEKDLAVAPSTAALSPQGVELPRDETEGVTSGAVMAPGIASTPGKTRRRRSGKQPESIITSVPEPGAVQESSEEGSDESDEEDEEDEEQSLIARGGVGIPIGEDGLPHPLLDELAPELKGRKCLVLDLDETLVHSSFKMVHQADYVVPVEIENQYHNVYVIKRPGVDGFLKAMGEIYEVVIFTASLSKYADPVLDQLDIHRVVKHRLFRESCYNNKGNYVKDLSQLGRPMSECIIIDNSPASYVFHVNNAVPISSWFNDPHDTELTDLVPFLTDLERVDDVRSVLDAGLYQQMTFA